jgi:hypothetical protein
MEWILVSRARHVRDAHVGSIIRHCGSHDHDEEKGFMPLWGAATKESCFFVKLRRISIRPKASATSEEFEFPYLFVILVGGRPLGDAAETLVS